MNRLWRDVAARLAVTAGALLPYLPVLSLDRVYITDDGFASDIFNGELPVRVLAGQLVASGQAPVWSSKLCSGMPLASSAIEPLSLGLFTALPAPLALCLFVVAFVLIAAQGAYSLARHVGAERTGAVLCGLAYGGSGYMVTQLKHLSIISTVAWLPWGLLLLDRALANTPPPKYGEPEAPSATKKLVVRMRDMGLFGLVYAEQVLAGFPQSAYIAGLVYAGWATVLLVRLRGRIGSAPIQLVLVPAMALAVILATMSGAATLLPLAELGKTSDRHGVRSWEFASMVPYSWSDTLNFLVPYANGDVADGTYHAPGFFWENYGYVGAATFLLAIFALIRGFRRPRVRLLFGIGVAAFVMVLGPRTPIYYIVWKYLPGMSNFRFPTRFLFVVELAICVLAAVGLSLLRPDVERLLARVAPRIAPTLPPAIALCTALDLFANQSHQNPFVPASEWLAKPRVVTRLGDSVGQARLFAPYHDFFHRLAHRTARGWSDLDPYRELRETVAPNTGIFWGVASADCYMGIAPTWFVDVWGDHSRNGLLVPALMRLGRDAIIGTEALAPVLASYGVTHLVSPIPIRGPQLHELEGTEPVHLYALAGKRARVVPNARRVHSNREAATVLSRPGFDLTRELLLHDSVPSRESTAPDLSFRGEASVTSESSQHLRVEVAAPDGGYLLLADNYYPGWHASVDGKAVTILRANISLRAVDLPPGARTVEFRYDAAPFFEGLKISLVSIALLLTWLLAAATIARLQHRRVRSNVRAVFGS